MIGAVLPIGVEIKKAKIRGKSSEGMLCSEQELKLAEESAGIMILPAETPLGKPLADALGLSDWLLEVEITPNRGDCLSVLGVARELASITGEKVAYPQTPIREDGPPIGDLVISPSNRQGSLPQVQRARRHGRQVGRRGLMQRRLSPLRHPPHQQRRGRHELPAARIRSADHAFDLDRLNGPRIDVRAPPSRCSSRRSTVGARESIPACCSSGTPPARSPSRASWAGSTA